MEGLCITSHSLSLQLLTSLTKTFIGTNAYMAVSDPLPPPYIIPPPHLPLTPPLPPLSLSGFLVESTAFHSEIWSLGVSLLEVCAAPPVFGPTCCSLLTPFLPPSLPPFLPPSLPPSLPSTIHSFLYPPSSADGHWTIPLPASKFV